MMSAFSFLQQSKYNAFTKQWIQEECQQTVLDVPVITSSQAINQNGAQRGLLWTIQENPWSLIPLGPIFHHFIPTKKDEKACEMQGWFR